MGIMARQLRPGQLRTGSLYDITSSFSISSSFSTNGFPFSGSAVITGSLTIKSDVNDIFIIKNFNNQPILTVSQSGVITVATQSAELTTPAPNGGIYFTSTSFWVGLD
jgi:hypothetical protein